MFMTCYLAFKNLVKNLLKISDDEAVEILQDIEKEVGHNKELIKAVIDIEGISLLKRLKKKKSKKEIQTAYA